MSDEHASEEWVRRAQVLLPGLDWLEAMRLRWIIQDAYVAGYLEGVHAMGESVKQIRNTE